MEGFLNINKPEGITSTDVVRVVKRELNVKKVGYIGTLDPMATGVLPVGMGRATKLFPFLEKTEKVYDAVLTLGSATDTQDRTGKVINEADPSHITEDMAREVMSGFVGEIEQMPPMYSAKKINGDRLYDLARQGIEVEREPVKTNIYEINFKEKVGPNISFTVRVSTGTYVRTLCHDIGEKLGVYGHLSDLVRAKSSNFLVEDSIPLDKISRDNLEEVEGLIISLADGLSHMSRAVVIPHAVDRLRNGMPIGVSDIIKFDHVEGSSMVRVVKKDGSLIAVGEMEGIPIAGFPFSTILPKKVMG